MAEKKRQHYVPKLYLKLFSWDDKKLINIYNISRKQIIHNGALEKQCYEDYFYGKDLVIENSLGTIEDAVPSIIENIIFSQSTPEPFSREHQIILLFVLQQYARTKHSAEAHNEFTNKLANILIKKSGKMTDDELENIRIRNTNPTIIPLGGIALSFPLAMDLKCKVLINETKLNFITSDNPVIFYNKALEYIKYGCNTGLALQGLKIILPISPKHILLFYDDKVYKIGKRKQLFSFILKKDDVRQFNMFQWLNACNNIYYGKNLPLSEIIKEAEKNICKRNPEKYFIDELSEENILHFYKPDLNIGMNIECIKQLKTVTLNNGHKPVRNPEMVKLHNEFSTLVCEGKYEGSQFKDFIQNKLVSE